MLQQWRTIRAVVCVAGAAGSASTMSTAARQQQGLHRQSHHTQKLEASRLVDRRNIAQITWISDTSRLRCSLLVAIGPLPCRLGRSNPFLPLASLCYSYDNPFCSQRTQSATSMSRRVLHDRTPGDGCHHLFVLVVLLHCCRCERSCTTASPACALEARFWTSLVRRDGSGPLGQIPNSHRAS
jgi:hypothetical protein